MINLKDKDEKIVGYVILIVGLCIMGFSISSVINLSQGGDIPIEILHAPERQSEQNMEPSDIDNNTSNMSAPSIDLGQIITPLYPLFNLIAWLVIAFVILVSGGRVAHVGIQMMKASLPDVRIVRNEIIKKVEKKEESISNKTEKKDEKK
jgi:hypothetical protein